MSKQRSAGFTLIELMMVVAIVGVMSALAGTAYQRMIRLGRVNGAGNRLVTAINNARIRAVTQRCPHFALITGRNYAPGAIPAGAPVLGPAIYIVQKGVCNATPPLMFYEEGVLPVVPPATVPADRDRVVATFRLDEALVDIASGLPAGTPGLAGAVSLGFDADGQLMVRDDPTGTGSPFQVPMPVPPDLRLTITSRDGQSTSTISVKTASGASVVQ